MSTVYMSSGGLAPSPTNLASTLASAPAPKAPVPVDLGSASPTRIAPYRTHSIVRVAKGHRITFVNGALVGAPLE